MKRPTFIAFICILALVIAGGGYIWLKNSPEGGTEIKTGQVQIDYNNLEELQRAVDEGQQPWRLDPLLVVESEAAQYGFSEEDTDTLKFSTYTQEELGTSIIKIQGEIQHEGKTYLITIGQAVPGKGNIWTVLDVQVK